jgi:hypothetical protein
MSFKRGDIVRSTENTVYGGTYIVVDTFADSVSVVPNQPNFKMRYGRVVDLRPIYHCFWGILKAVDLPPVPEEELIVILSAAVEYEGGI